MILFAVFIVLSAFAISKAEEGWRLWNGLIILGGCGVGFLVAYLAGLWARNMAFGGEIALPLTFAFGSLAAVLCHRKRKITKAESGL
jgi:hypothetical protein